MNSNQEIEEDGKIDGICFSTIIIINVFIVYDLYDITMNDAKILKLMAMGFTLNTITTIIKQQNKTKILIKSKLSQFDHLFENQIENVAERRKFIFMI